MAELERLAGRIAWLDRFRRPLSILAAAITAPLLILALTGWLPENWPAVHMIAIALMVAVFAWYGIETLLGLMLAVWETDYAKLTRPPSLPRAELLQRKK